MDLRRLSGADMVGRHHPPQRGDERSLGIGQEGRDPRERLVLLGIENVKDRADQQRMRGFFPMVAPFERSEEHTSELQSLMRISYAVFCLKKKITNIH